MQRRKKYFEKNIETIKETLECNLSEEDLKAALDGAFMSDEETSDEGNGEADEQNGTSEKTLLVNVPRYRSELVKNISDNVFLQND